MIGWVHTLCNDWAAHKRHIHEYTQQQPLPGTLGQRALCVQYRRGKRVGREPIRTVATRGVPVVRYPEVWTENALAVQRAMEGMPAVNRALITIHYLYPVSVPRKIEMVANLSGGKLMSPSTYWRRVHSAHCWIASKIPLTDGISTRKSA
jgi:hypothetical protein